MTEKEVWQKFDDGEWNEFQVRQWLSVNSMNYQSVNEFEEQDYEFEDFKSEDGSVECIECKQYECVDCGKLFEAYISSEFSSCYIVCDACELKEEAYSWSEENKDNDLF